MSVFLNAYRTAKRLRDKACSLAFSGSFHRFGRRTVICLPVRLGGEGHMEIGAGVYVGAGSWIEVMGAPDSSPVISIGDETSISGFCTITAVSKVVIGRSVLIARNVHISDHSHQFASKEIPVKDQGICRISPVHIQDGAWIGHGVVICPGVTIGRNAVVGANSVVREDVPDHCVAAGVPARIVRRPQ